MRRLERDRGTGRGGAWGHWDSVCERCPRLWCRRRAYLRIDDDTDQNGQNKAQVPVVR